MSAAPVTTQGSSSTAQGPGAESSNKRPRRNDDEGDQPNDENDLSYSDDGGYDSSDGELTLEESMKRQRKKAGLRMETSEGRRRDAMLADIANAHDTPKAASQISQAIYEYTRMLMGISRKSRMSNNDHDSTLPPPPSDDEMKAWVNRQEDREEVIRKAMERGMRKYLAKKPDNFKPNRTQIRTVEKDAADRARLTIKLKPVKFTSRLDHKSSCRYAHNWGTKCEGALALAGFPRCTFDWEAGYDSPWNSSVSAIIISQWVKCFDAKGARAFAIVGSDNTDLNRDEVLRRWFKNKKGDYRKQTRNEILIRTSQGRAKVEADKAYSKKVISRRRGKAKIHKARLSVVKELFGEQSAEYGMLNPREVHSEDELSSAAPSKVRLGWRSAELDTFISLVDQCVWGRETDAALRRSARHLIERGPYSTTPDVDLFPPKKYQRSLVSPTWISSMQGVALTHLELNTTNVVDIRRAIMKLTKELASTPSTSQ
ncbi:uncharacterized protein MELLADRAFT_86507 [Melampsora larici-populina 98AG31]|uniref:Uncharacterized protein n=1 Tax=Melampsora larici-populina (strain 98AG31 / pathotype 3-4-7) TaxID=747676 RepID=F4RM36_MELLP|nr:uncharacterized protein MELLADRAFT_86507 [Melampsora larici-populina 98AG31]EGG06656.1 hypothetical protein MELLADRAFT_86507 [Melampsora larici-populina 98AG31]